MYFTIETCHFLFINKKNHELKISQLELGTRIPKGYWFKDIIKNNREEIRNYIKEFPDIQEMSSKDWINDTFYFFSIKQLRKMKLLSLNNKDMQEKIKKLEKLLYNKSLIRIWEEKPISTGSSG